ncbi:MAG: DUF4124 domain-containing protein [Gammaproteobacteria bacterium]|nr:DUF4124 domain-containing protein [Gammaproteobacteria bacterium]
MRKLIEFSLLILCLPLLMGAEVYRWVDPNGVVNYTQMKPPGVKAQQITAQAGRPMVVAEATDQLAGRPGSEPDESSDGPALTENQQTMLQDLQAAEQARQAEVNRIKQANCEKSRNVLNRLSGAERIRVRDSGGVERIMAEDERQRRINDAQRGISENCTS